LQQTIREGLDLAQQLIALPFKAARQVFRETAFSHRPTGEVVTEALHLGEDLARLPLKAAAALAAELPRRRPDLEARVSKLEHQIGVAPAAGETPAEGIPPVDPPVTPDPN
jgi:hypothetical protein